MRPIPWAIASRADVYANDMPSNRALPNDVTPESLELGWTVQQPYAHVNCVVALACVLCGQSIGARNWGAHLCPVDIAIGDKLWAQD